jgi:hypothetical protein
MLPDVGGVRGDGDAGDDVGVDDVGADTGVAVAVMGVGVLLVDVRELVEEFTCISNVLSRECESESSVVGENLIFLICLFSGSGVSGSGLALCGGSSGESNLFMLNLKD